VKVCLECGERFGVAGWRCPSCGFEPLTQRGRVVFAMEPADEGEAFDPHSFEHLPGVEERSFWFRARNELVAWALRSYFPDAGMFLEVGCGTGFVLEGLHRRFPGLRLSGGELFAAGLDTAAERVPAATLYQLDARRIPFDAEFDVVGAFDVLEHIENDEVALAEMARAVRPGGGVLITVPQHPRLWSDVDEFSRHRRRYRRSELRAKLERSGLDVVRLTSFVTLLLPAMVASRLRQRKGPETFDPLAEYGHGPLVDSALGWAMALERKLIRLGLSLPAGGSLLAVARRP
jgi:SAM-dependent methyltransferase